MKSAVLALVLCACAYGQRTRSSTPTPFHVQETEEDEKSPLRIVAIGDNIQPVIPSTPEPTDQSVKSRTDAPYIPPIPIVRLSKQMSIDGSYKTSYETGNSIVAEETGFLKNPGIEGQEGLVQYGSYSYTDPDGRLITVRYTADEGGFRAEGDHLPTPPPIPPEIQKGLDVIYESIRLQQKKEAEERQRNNVQLESRNFPETASREDSSRYYK